MTARLLAVVLAFAIVGAPVSLTMCEVACASRSADAMHGGRGEHHSCHQAAASNEVRIGGLPHGCGHSDGNDQIGADSSTRAFAPSTLAVDDVASILIALGASTRVSVRAVTHGPPVPLSLSTQLRI